MRILYLTPQLPYPPHTGGQLRSWFLLKELSRRGSVTLATFGRPEQYEEHVPKLKEHCARIFWIDPKKFKMYQKLSRWSSLGARFDKLFRLQPWLLDDFVDPEILAQIDSAKPAEHDLIVCRFLVTAYYFLTEKKYRPLLDRILVDVDDISTIVQERAIRNTAFGYRKLRDLFDLFLLKHCYRKLQKVRACFVVSQKDRLYAAKNRMFQRSFVVPNVFEVNGRTLTLSEELKTQEILFCGMMSYPPNQDAVVYFCDRIFPAIKKEIPDARFTVVGKHTPEHITKLGRLPGVTVAGYVPSMEPYYERAAVVVVPLLNGGGTRIKILEAMAYGRPVVSTSVGAEGLEVLAEEHILIADEPRQFAKRCVELLQNPGKRADIASRAYRLVKEKYDTGVFRKKMDEIFEAVAMNGGNAE